MKFATSLLLATAASAIHISAGRSPMAPLLNEDASIVGDVMIAAMKQAYSETKNLQDEAVKLELGGKDQTEKLIAEVAKVYGDLEGNGIKEKPSSDSELRRIIWYVCSDRFSEEHTYAPCTDYIANLKKWAKK